MALPCLHFLPTCPPAWRAGILSYPCFLGVDISGNVVVANSGCDAVAVLSRETGLAVVSLPLPQPIGVYVTDTNTIVASSSGKHCVSIF